MENKRSELLLSGHGTSFEELLNELELGVAVFDRIKCKPLFLNRYFSKIVPGERKKILEKICDHVKVIDAGSGNGMDQPAVLELKKNPDVKYGFSVYSVGETFSIVFLNEITSKFIANKNQMDNFLYDKMSELIAEIAHEIGNPLAGISTMLELLISKIDSYSVEKIQLYLKRTFHEINRLTNILRRIRKVYVDNKMEIVEADLRETLDNVFLMNREIFEKKNVSFINNIDEDQKVLIDKGAFYQVVKNLFDNSLSVLRSGQWIKLSVENVDDNFVRLIYSNNGAPISEDLYKKIFIPLFSTRKEGTGLGLFISLKLMTRMGGTINIEKPGEKKGVRFILFIRRQHD